MLWYLLLVSAIMGKSKGQLHRLAMVLQALSDASGLLRDCGEDYNMGINESLQLTLPTVVPIQDETECVQHADGVHDNCPVRVVTSTAAHSAVTLMKYFIRQKKYMSGYAAEGSVDGETGSSSTELHLQPPIGGLCCCTEAAPN